MTVIPADDWQWQWQQKADATSMQHLRSAACLQSSAYDRSQVRVLRMNAHTFRHNFWGDIDR